MFDNLDIIIYYNLSTYPYWCTTHSPAQTEDEYVVVDRSDVEDNRHTAFDG